MSLERILDLVARYRKTLQDLQSRALKARWQHDSALGRELLESMLSARHLDVAAHELRAAGHGHYTICSSGHEANVVLGRLTTTTDPTLAHYRSAALVIERARHVPGSNPIREIALSLVASSEEPISGGRHKVFGSQPLGILPQTSTIASHLPRAVGLAFALERRRRLGLDEPFPPDAIAVASFGDASINHSTALGAFNAASWTAHQNLAVPLLLVCEDNGLGVSVRTPPNWVEARLRTLPHIEYFAADGGNLSEAWTRATEAIRHCRLTRRPAVLHLACVRLLGHAGSDVDTVYRSPDEIEQAFERDPVLRMTLELIAAGTLTPAQALALDALAERRVREETEHAIGRPKLGSREQVMRAIARPISAEVERAAGRDLRSLGSSALTLAQGINAVLGEALDRHRHALIFGEDVGKKGGVYGVTKGLFQRGGPARVFNTLLDEQTILGLALGTASLGLMPIPEIQYLAYLHNAEDQLRGEAATMQFFSDCAFDNPMLVRIAGFGYQKGFGGHFHNDNAIAVLRDIPGLIVLVPARADDAIALYRTALALATETRRVIVAIEPIALYHSRDLYAEGDAGWLAAPPTDAASFLAPRVYQPDARDLVIATYGNGVWLSLRAARRLEHELGIRVRVLDLRWLVPLPADALIEHANDAGRLLVVDECRRSAGISEAIAALLLDRNASVRFARVTSADSFIPLGDAANLILLGEDEIVETAKNLVRH
jgi:2-oxoisovalerate dehydrogenase E1 component